MCKRLLLITTLLLAMAVPTYAHLTGAFADFLAIVYDETTISTLHEELAQTRADIEALTPQVAEAENVFRDNQQQAIMQLQAYAETGLDTWLTMMKQGNDVVDLLGNQWLMEQQITTYLQQLNVLYSEFKTLEQAQQSLQGHEQLLYAIEKNLQAREAFLAETAGLELDVIANYLDIDWTAEVEAHIIADLTADMNVINDELLQWVQQPALTLPEQWLNDKSAATYYFRNDHIYMEYELEFAHVLILGQVLQQETGDAAQFVIEAGFYNGFFLPEELLVELPGWSIAYETLQQLDGVDQPYITQQNGYLQIVSK